MICKLLVSMMSRPCYVAQMLECSEAHILLVESENGEYEFTLNEGRVDPLTVIDNCRYGLKKLVIHCEYRI